MYQAPVISKPRIEETSKISEELKLGIPEDELPIYHQMVCGLLDTKYQVLEKYSEPVLPVKYPRTPGYRPKREENKYNAWYYKTDIMGADSGLLKGYNIAIKDSIPVAGVPMMQGSRVLEGYVPDYDPTVVTRILDAGGVICGKAVCEDMCLSGGSYSSHPAPVLNPHDTTRNTGGSSSGCAALIESGEVDMALGCDQAGSIRIPASWTGIVGLKPTYGLVPYTGIGGMAPAVDHCGPMAKTVTNCARMLEVIAGDDNGLDMRQRNIPPPSLIPKYSQKLCADLSGKRIGLLKEGLDDCHPAVAAVIRTAVTSMAQGGATVADVSIPMHSDGEAIWFPTGIEGMYHSMLQQQGFCVGPPSYYSTSAIDNYFTCSKTRQRDAPDIAKMGGIVCKYVHDNYGMRFYAKSQNLARLLRAEYDKVLETYDVLVMPTIKYTATKLPQTSASMPERLSTGLNISANTSPFNLTGHPALSINAGYVERLPVGIMLVGSQHDDQTVLDVAYGYETIRDAD